VRFGVRHENDAITPAPSPLFTIPGNARNLPLLDFVIPSNARNLLFVRSRYAADHEQIPRRITRGRNGKIAAKDILQNNRPVRFCAIYFLLSNFFPVLAPDI